MKLSTQCLLLSILHVTFAIVFLLAGDLLAAHGEYLNAAIVAVLPILLAFFAGMYAIGVGLARHMEDK